jgi:hypothetical protein
MDAVVRDALREVGRAQAALADAEERLRAAWRERNAALEASGWSVTFVHDTHRAPLVQSIVVLDDAGGTVDVAALAAEAVGREEMDPDPIPEEGGCRAPTRRVQLDG